MPFHTNFNREKAPLLKPVDAEDLLLVQNGSDRHSSVPSENERNERFPRFWGSHQISPNRTWEKKMRMIQVKRKYRS